ncbi:DUF1214 domain-containing protein [Ruegeria arenilitoris]|uniref:DUF1214 domain-containing protein n=1 Tax=Ruegeria arenilitoris TaxID=1173585 RepID=UPI00147EBCDB|nr:DUF1214 domain-containing protein [Ruegeria arenilitoris]
MKTVSSFLAIVAAAGLAVPAFAEAPVTVNVTNFVRAETDMYHQRIVDLGGFGGLMHIREPVPLDAQDVIRMNRDTLYSGVVIDLTEPASIVLPDSEGRFMSMLILNQDHYVVGVVHDAGTYHFTEKEVGTRYMSVLFRTFADENDPSDIAEANALQDAIEVYQSNAGHFEVPIWDAASRDLTRELLLPLAQGLSGNTFEVFGTADAVNPISHLVGAAAGWGGNPPAAAVYDIQFPDRNDGSIPHTLTVGDVPVDGFWSVTVYDASGYMVPNEAGAYSVNNVTSVPNEDGTVTIHFGDCEDGRVNCLPIMDGWNYVVRLYQPGPEILEDGWALPIALPIDQTS